MVNVALHLYIFLTHLKQIVYHSVHLYWYVILLYIHKDLSELQLVTVHSYWCIN